MKTALLGKNIFYVMAYYWPFYCEAVWLECIPTSHSGVMDSFFFPGIIYTYLYCQAAK